MSFWPEPGPFQLGDRVLLTEHYSAADRTDEPGTVTHVKRGKYLYPFEATFDNGMRGIFEAHELEKIK